MEIEHVEGTEKIMIKAILACDDRGGVSKDGTLPWPHNSRDLMWFKSNTAGHVVIMGSTTWKDPHMPRPLPKRKNILVTRKPENYPGADGYIQGVLTTEIKKIEEENKSLITWVIGGPHIIGQCLNIIDQFYISRIPGDYQCDTFLPLDKIEEQFEKDWEVKHEGNEAVTIQIWKRK